MQKQFDVFVMQAKEQITVRMKQINEGDIRWNVSNQFDESILESAYANLVNDEATRYKCYALFNAELPDNIMTLAHMASTFEVEPLADAWTQ